MIVRVLGRDRYYYRSKRAAKVRKALFEVEGYEVIISHVYVLDDWTARPYMKTDVQSLMSIVAPPPDNVMFIGWRVMQYDPDKSKGNWSRSC